MVVRDRDDHCFVRSVLADQFLEAGTHRRRRADDRSPAARRWLLLEESDRRLDRRHRDQPPLTQQRHRHARARGEALRLVVVLGAHNGDRDADERSCTPPRRDEAVAIELRDLGARGIDEVREDVRQAKLAGPDCTLRRRAEQPHLRPLGAARQRGEPRERMAVGEVVLEVGEQLRELLREVIRRHLPSVTLQRKHRLAVASRGTTDAEVDAARIERREHAEHLCDLERAVVRQHHAAATDLDPRCRRRNRSDQNLGRGAREHRCAVMLGDPVALVAERFDMLREVDRVAQGIAADRALRDRRLVEHAERNCHLSIVPTRLAPKIG